MLGSAAKRAPCLSSPHERSPWQPWAFLSRGLARRPAARAAGHALACFLAGARASAPCSILAERFDRGPGLPGRCPGAAPRRCVCAGE